MFRPARISHASSVPARTAWGALLAARRAPLGVLGRAGFPATQAPRTDPSPLAPRHVVPRAREQTGGGNHGSLIAEASCTSYPFKPRNMATMASEWCAHNKNIINNFAGKPDGAGVWRAWDASNNKWAPDYWVIHGARRAARRGAAQRPAGWCCWVVRAALALRRPRARLAPRASRATAPAPSAPCLPAGARLRRAPPNRSRPAPTAAGCDGAGLMGDCKLGAQYFEHIYPADYVSSGFARLDGLLRCAAPGRCACGRARARARTSASKYTCAHGTRGTHKRTHSRIRPSLSDGAPALLPPPRAPARAPGRS